MKTVFVCKALNLRVEGLDSRPYAVDERITLKHQGRWLPMIVDEVRETGGIRQVLLRLNRSPEPLLLRRAAPAVPAVADAPLSSPNWVEAMLSAIEGETGPVRW